MAQEVMTDFRSSSKRRGCHRLRWTQVFYLISFALGSFFVVTANILASLMKMQSSPFRPFWISEFDAHNLRNSTSLKKDLLVVTAVIVEMRCYTALSVALLGAVRNLGPEVVIIVMHSSHNKLFVKGVIESFPLLMDSFQGERLRLHEIREQDWGRICPPEKRNAKSRIPFQYSADYWYSRMFVNDTFWSQFETQYALTLQSDTLLCHHFPTQDLIRDNVSFTGGISDRKSTGTKGVFEKYSVLPNPRGNVTVRSEHLNGGLSLRNIPWVRHCIETFGIEQGGWVEDDLFVHCRANNLPGTVHETDMGAYAFASNNGHTMCFTSPSHERLCPLGVHKPWSREVQKPTQYIELEKNCEGLATLKSLVARGVQDTQSCQAFDMEGAEISTFRCDCNFQRSC